MWKEAIATIQKYHVFVFSTRPGTAAANLWLCGNHQWMGNSILEVQPRNWSAL